MNSQDKKYLLNPTYLGLDKIVSKNPKELELYQTIDLSLHKDSVFGIESNRFFFGSSEEAFNILCYFGERFKEYFEDFIKKNVFDLKVGDFLDNLGLLDLSELSGVDKKLADLEEENYAFFSKDSYDEEDFDKRKIEEDFDNRLVEISNWSFLELWFSALYKYLCAEIHPYSNTLIELETKKTGSIKVGQFNEEKIESWLKKGDVNNAASHADYTLSTPLEVNPISFQWWRKFLYLLFLNLDSQSNHAVLLETDSFIKRNPWILQYSQKKKKTELKKGFILNLNQILQEINLSSSLKIKECGPFYCDRVAYSLKLFSFSPEKIEALLKKGTWDDLISLIEEA